jgi:putative ABC transport system permease protein
MFRHYLVMVVRSFARHKLYSLINVVGLSVGLTCVIFAIVFVRDELSYDKWIPGTQHLYRVELTIRLPDRPPLPLAVTPFPMPAAMRAEVPGVTGMTRLYGETLTLTSGDRSFVEQVDAVDPGFFKVIRLPLITGNPGAVLLQSESVVLSESVARKIFGDVDPIGRIITTGRENCERGDSACHGERVSLQVTGVARDLPHNSQLTGDVFIPNTSLADRTSQDIKDDWFDQDGWGYVTLASGADPAAVVASMGPLLDRAVTPVLRRTGIRSRGNQAYEVHLTPFTEVHLASSRWEANMTPPGSWDTLYGVVAIGVLILLTACFNFTNLATARAQLRAREIALRKVAGATRRQLVLQLLGEAVLMALVALVLAFAIGEVLLPLFGDVLHRPIAFHYASDRQLLLALVGVAVATGLISGSYPALVLAGFRPAAALRDTVAGHTGSGWLRNVLVLLQFAVSIGLGIVAIVVFSQISYARNMALGFRHNDIVVIGGGALTAEKQRAFAQALRANPGITEVGLSDSVPFEPGQSLFSVQVPGQTELLTFNKVVTGPDYPGVYGIALIAGRLLSASRADDQIHSAEVEAGGDPLNEGRNVLINATAARRLGFTPQEAVGRIVLLNHNHVNIVGVLADAKVQGAHDPVKPSVYVYIPTYPMSFSVRVRAGMVPQTMTFIDRTWRALSPDVAIQRYFLDQDFNRLYLVEERQGTLLGIFVGIAILIACLGLFGLAVFTAERRTKEIGIRKISGARTRDIVWLMVWRISIPVLIANVVAWPVAYYYLRHWLEGYAYHISLSPLYFLIAGAVALAIAWATVYTNTLRLARASPIHALRYA